MKPLGAQVREGESVAALLLAGGRGSRFEGSDHKLLAPFRGRPLAAWAMGAVRQTRVDGVTSAAYVVSGAISLRPAMTWLINNDLSRPADSDSNRDRDDDDRLARALDLTLIVNERWAEGQATSLAAGVARAAADGHDAVVVGLADQPFVDHHAWAAVAEADGPINIATFDGMRRPPVKLRSETWPLLPQIGDEGARSLLRLRPDLVSEVACIGNPVDIDTMEDLRRWS